MSIQRYCDGCGDRIFRNVVTQRLEGVHQAPSGASVSVAVIAGVGRGHSNNGDLCVACVVAAVADAGQWVQAAEDRQRSASSPPD